MRDKTNLITNVSCLVSKLWSIVIAFDCGWSDWGSCSESCGKGTRKRQYRNAVTQRSESGCIPPTRQCYDIACSCVFPISVVTTIVRKLFWCVGGKLNLTKIGASATQGPQNQSDDSMSASLAIDGRIVTDDSDTLILSQCAASQTRSSVRPWLRVDLQSVYLINKVVITFYGSTGRRTIIRVGSSTSNDGNGNLLCGTVGNYGNPSRKSRQRKVMCKERLWGKFVNLQRLIAGRRATFEICEVEIYNG